jgi:hypothetical protein
MKFFYGCKFVIEENIWIFKNEYLKMNIDKYLNLYM